MRANASSPSSDSHGSAATVPKALSAVRRLTCAGFDSRPFCMAHHAADAGARSRTSGATPEGHKAVGRDVRPAFTLSIWPLHGNRSDGGRRAEARVEPDIARRQVAPIRADAAPEGRASRSFDTNPAANPEPVSRPLVEPHLQPVVLPAGLVEQPADRPAVVREDDVHVAVVVLVAQRRAPAHLAASESGAGKRAGL